MAQVPAASAAEESKLDLNMENSNIYDEASNVDAEDGVVTVSGPDDVDVRLTPDAAEETSQRLMTGALKARGQIYFSADRDE